VNRIESIIYINLDHRTDRRAEFEVECARLNIPPEKVVRFPAIKMEDPTVGCASSHARALRLAHSLGVGNALICEDDFAFHEEPRVVQRKLAHFFNLVDAGGMPWSAVQLAHQVYESERFDGVVSIARRASNAAGYLVNRPLMQPLAQTIEDAIPKLAETKMHWHYANDVVWCEHMADGRWFFFTERLGCQRPSYSDLSRAFVHERR
jgi:glycosyl transferase family 25